MKDRRLVSVPGHEPLLDDRGWSNGWAGPGTMTVGCGCGWHGLTIHERWFTPGENEAASFSEPYRGFVAQYGAEVMLSGDNDAYGTREDAIRLYLDHVGYDPEADRKRVVSDLLETIDMVRAITVAPGVSLNQIASAAPETSQALNAVTAAAARLALWEEAPLLTPVTPDPEGRRLIEAYQRAQREAAAAREVTDAEFLQTLLDEHEGSP